MLTTQLYVKSAYIHTASHSLPFSIPHHFPPYTHFVDDSFSFFFAVIFCSTIFPFIYFIFLFRLFTIFTIFPMRESKKKYKRKRKYEKIENGYPER